MEKKNPKLSASVFFGGASFDWCFLGGFGDEFWWIIGGWVQ